MAKYSATLKGKGFIKNFGGGKTKWVDREIDWFGVYQHKGKPIKATLKLTGANWMIQALSVDSENDNEFTKLFDANARGGRFIGGIDVGTNADIDLKSTSIGYLFGDAGNHGHPGNYDVVLGSGELDRARLDGDVTLVGGTGEIGSLRIGGTADVTINAGGAGRVRTDDGDDSVTVDNGGEVDVVRTKGGDDSVTVQGGASVGLVRTDSGDDSVTIQGGAGVGLVYTGDGNDTVTANGWFETINTGSGNDTVTSIGGGELIRTEDGDDTVTTGTGYVTTIDVGDGNDTVNLGSAWATTVVLANGDDKLALTEFVPDDPSDIQLMTAYGGDGVDTLDFSALTSGVTFALNSLSIQLVSGTFGSGGSAYMLAVEFENLIGSAQADVLTGDSNNNSFTGGAGADVFDFADDVLNPGVSGTDTVTDFSQAEGDRLRLVGQNFAGLTITDSGVDLQITHADGVILLSGLAGTTLTAADFLFA